MKIDYIGNGAYCYSNSASMLLSSIGEKISPSIIEVICGVGLSAFWLSKNNLLFFNFALPDEELSRVFKILGFDCKERIISKKEPAPIQKLKEDLKKSPAIVGPIDMGYLIYNPNYRFLGGSDHYVLVYDFDDKDVYLHDPEKFPCVSVSFKQLKLAWESKKILYGLENYQYWTDPKRAKIPSKKEIYNQTIKDFKSIYRSCDKKSTENNWITGKEAILTCVERVQEKKITREEIDHLVYFALPLGAKRALDFAIFFDFQDNDLATLKRKQAELFGMSQVFAMNKNLPELAKTFREFAEVEDEFKSLLLKK